MSTPPVDPQSTAWNLYVASQPFNLTGIDGSPVPLTLTVFNNFVYSEYVAIATYGFQVGFTSMLLIVLAMTTTRMKATRPIFILNYAAVFLAFLRSILALASFCQQFLYGFGEAFLGARAQYPLSSFGPLYLVQSCILGTLLYSCLLSSLILQTRVVFAAEPTTRKLVTLLLSLVAALIVIMYFVFQVFEMMNLWGSYSSNTYVPKRNYQWLMDTVRYGFLAFLALSCLMFIYKLFVTIQRRRRMGFKRFSPLHILLIMFR